MKDYWLQMVMFKYCHSLYPTVKYSMHAGELTLGLVAEDLTWHIRAAVYTAGAYRMGMVWILLAYEENPYELLALYGKKIVLHRN
jgi:adenosine deaminase/adenosine deaminase CECR1